MPITLAKRGSNPDPAFDIPAPVNDSNMLILEGAVESLEDGVVAAAAAAASKLPATDPAVTNPRPPAEGDYAAFVVDSSGNADLDPQHLSDKMVAFSAAQAEAAGEAIIAPFATIPTSATFRDWRNGTSIWALMTPVTFKAITAPRPYAYPGAPMTLDFGDAAGADPDVGKIRTLNPVITGVTGNLTLTFAGFAGTTLVGQEVCVMMVSNSAGSKTLAVAAGAGQTVTPLVGATPPLLGGIGKRAYVWVRFVSDTEIDIIAWGATP